MRDIPARVQRVTSTLMQLLDARLPGQLEALYLTGSVAQGDYRDGLSDIDFVAVLREAPDENLLSAIHDEVAQQHRQPDCSGIYLRPGDLAEPAGGTGMSVREGRVRAQSDEERHPVAWLMLADHGIALRGRQPDTRWIAADRQAAIDYSRQNMQSYWRKWLGARRHLASAAGLLLLSEDAVTWGALGVARLHATIETGRVPSKTGAGQHALSAFPEHARIVAEGLRVRADPASRSGYATPLSRRRDLIAYMDAVIGSVAHDTGLRK